MKHLRMTTAEDTTVTAYYGRTPPDPDNMIEEKRRPLKAGRLSLMAIVLAVMPAVSMLLMGLLMRSVPSPVMPAALATGIFLVITLGVIMGLGLMHAIVRYDYDLASLRVKYKVMTGMDA